MKTSVSSGILMALLLTTSLFAQEQTKVTSSGATSTATIAVAVAAAPPDGVGISGGVYRRIRSTVLNEDRTVLIRLPENYGKGQKRYPVLYQLDGNRTVFLQTVGSLEYLVDWEQAPDYIVVGIENTDRGRDMLPERGADPFIRFLAEDLVPFIESNYRTSETRVLCGQSLSSVFAIYTCLQAPELFDGYVLSSFGLSEVWLRRFEMALGQRSRNPKRHHWVYVGNAREDAYDKDGSRTRLGLTLLDSLKKAEGQALNLECRVFDDQGHVPFPTLHYALRWMANLDIGDAKRSTK